MPFTISHAAAVLPFSRFLARRRLLSAALIGSMIPDFGWFMPWRPTRFETHSVIGLLTFCLPAGLTVYWIFQRLIKMPLVELLPDGAYARWRAFAAPADYTDPLQWIWASCGLLAGALTHLVWDAFTHEHALGMRMIPALDEPAVQIGGHHLAGAHLLQDASSLIGLIAVVAMLLYGLRRGSGTRGAPARRLSAGERRLWMGGFVLAAAILSGAFFLMKHPAEPATRALAVPLSGAAIAVLRGLAAAMLSVSVCLRLRLRRQPA
ncbi:MAG: DUF4184 family protein [Steroidobacteraceae bacterium]|jgi:hypothetical protein